MSGPLVTWAMLKLLEIMDQKVKVNSFSEFRFSICICFQCHGAIKETVINSLKASFAKDNI